MNFWEKRHFFNKKNRGLVLSPNHRLSLKDSFTHLCLIAPTGGGKTASYVIPNIVHCSGSILVTDPDGSIYKMTRAYMQKKGYCTQTLNFMNPQESLRFNTLVKPEQNTEPKTNFELKQIATTLGSQNSAGNNQDIFWKYSAINIVYVCLVALKNADIPEKNTIRELRRLLNLFGVDEAYIESFMANHLDELTMEEYKAFIAQEEKVIANAISSARVALASWDDPRVIEITSDNTIDISALRNRKSIIYVIVPKDDISYFSIPMNLFYGECFRYCMQHKKGEDVFFLLDEFGNLGNIPNFDGIATTLRDAHCSLSVILQEKAQLRKVYGEAEAQTIYGGGMANKLFFGGSDLDTCEYVEKKMGYKTRYDAILPSGELRENKTTHTVRMPLMPASEIGMIPDERAILISGKKRPVYLKMPLYYKQFKMWQKLGYRLMLTEYLRKSKLDQKIFFWKWFASK